MKYRKPNYDPSASNVLNKENSTTIAAPTATAAPGAWNTANHIRLVAFQSTFSKLVKTPTLPLSLQHLADTTVNKPSFNPSILLCDIYQNFTMCWRMELIKQILVEKLLTQLKNVNIAEDMFQVMQWSNNNNLLSAFLYLCIFT